MLENTQVGFDVLKGAKAVGTQCITHPAFPTSVKSAHLPERDWLLLAFTEAWLSDHSVTVAFQRNPVYLEVCSTRSVVTVQ